MNVLEGGGVVNNVEARLIKIVFLSFALSSLFQILAIEMGHRYALFTDSTTKKQAIHHISVPRAGGIGLYFSFLITSFFFSQTALILALSGLLVFGFGLYEDHNGNTKKEYRLASMAISTLIVVYLTDYTAQNMVFFILPYWISVFFTVFTVVGFSSAMNFIDGLNGLSSGVALISLFFFGLAVYICGDIKSLSVILILIGSIGGFFLFNYPKGRIFLGDGGAYFLGYILAIVVIMIADRNTSLSLWYPLAALSYPVIETLVTIARRIRRKKRRGIPFFEVEKVHLHTLTCKRLTHNNAKATNRILIVHLLINIAAFVFRKNIWVLIAMLPAIYFIYMNRYKKLMIHIK